MASEVRRARLMLALRLVVIAALAVGMYYMLRGLHVEDLWTDLKAAKLWPIAIGAAISFVILGCKALAWHIMLAPEHVVPVGRLWRYTVSAFAASVIVPARGGEVLRIVTLKRKDGVPATRSTAVALAEKLLDGIGMMLIMAPLPWLLPDLPASITWWIGGLAAFAIVMVIALRIAVGRVTRPGWSQGWLGRLIAGMEVLRRPGRFFGTLALLTLGWVLDLGMVQLVMYAVGIDVPWAGALLVLFTLNLAIAVPSTPGQAGALEFGALVGTDILGVPREPAFAFAILYHAMQIVPLVIAGLLIDGKLLFGKWPAADAAPPANPS